MVTAWNRIFRNAGYRENFYTPCGRYSSSAMLERWEYGNKKIIKFRKEMGDIYFTRSIIVVSPRKPDRTVESGTRVGRWSQDSVRCALLSSGLAHTYASV